MRPGRIQTQRRPRHSADARNAEPSQYPGAAEDFPVELPRRPAEPAATLGPAKIPSCVLVGQKQLDNFALNDINGDPWELKANRTGKLVLLDFWATWCKPCQKTIPTLLELKSRYGSQGQGLEVVGIALRKWRHNLRTSLPSQRSSQESQYHLPPTPRQWRWVHRQPTLGVRAYPTLILLDEQGTIIWAPMKEWSATTAPPSNALIRRASAGRRRIERGRYSEGVPSQSPGSRSAPWVEGDRYGFPRRGSIKAARFG